jgi:hypothetical protein
MRLWRWRYGVYGLIDVYTKIKLGKGGYICMAWDGAYD